MSARPRIPVATVCIVRQNGRSWEVVVSRRRAAARHGGAFEFPGGKVEPGESTEAAARREVGEEVGLELGPLVPLMTFDHEYEHAIVALHVFLAECAPGSTTTATPREVDEVAWHDLAGLDRLDWLPANRAILATLAKRLRFE